MLLSTGNGSAPGLSYAPRSMSSSPFIFFLGMCASFRVLSLWHMYTHLGAAVMNFAVVFCSLFGFEKVSRNYHTLRINFLTAKEALRKDSLVDANRDGIADVQQLDKDELLSRQLSIFFKSVNPDEVRRSFLSGPSSVYVAVGRPAIPDVLCSRCF